MAVQNHRFSLHQAIDITKTTADFTLRVGHQYLSTTRSYDAKRFIFEMTMLAWFLKMVIAWPINLTILWMSSDHAVWQNPQRAAFTTHPVTNAMLTLAVAPILETLLGQWAPIIVVRQWTLRQRPALVVATLFFAVLHIFSWDIMMGVAIMPIGLVLAWSFLVWEHRSFIQAVGVTAAIHTLHNIIALVLMIL